MRIISLHQYWASLMAFGFKKVETRSWSTPYRGWLAIHASKTKEWRREYENSSASKLLFGFGLKFDDLPFGAIVCVVNITACVQTERIETLQYLSDHEREFGDYSSGRFAWVTKDCFRLKEPYPYKGQQGMWTLPEEVVSELRKRVVKL